MKISTIAIYRRENKSAVLLFHDNHSFFNTEHNKKSHIKKIAQTAQDDTEITNGGVIFVTGNKKIYYLKKHDQEIYLFASDIKISLELAEIILHRITEYATKPRIDKIASFVAELEKLAEDDVNKQAQFKAVTSEIHENIETTNEILQTNIESLLVRGERLEALVERTRQLQTDEMLFKTTSQRKLAVPPVKEEKFRACLCCC